MTKTSFIPDGYYTATPYLIVRGAVKAIDFYKQAFGAEELFRMPIPGSGPETRIGHAEIRIGNSPIMLADENLEMGARSPQTLGGSPMSLLIYFPDCDAVFARAIAAGAKAERSVQDQFYGDRSGIVIDPFGHRWGIATHIEDVAPDEVQRRFEKICAAR